MHQMRISTTQVFSVMLRSKKLEIREKNVKTERAVGLKPNRVPWNWKQNMKPNPLKDRAMHEGDNPLFWDEFTKSISIYLSIDRSIYRSIYLSIYLSIKHALIIIQNSEMYSCLPRFVKSRHLAELINLNVLKLSQTDPHSLFKHGLFHVSNRQWNDYNPYFSENLSIYLINYWSHNFLSLI
jgi:hypothetical protein